MAYNNRGVLRHQTGDTPGAIEDYTQATKLTPPRAVPFYNRGQNKLELKDYQGAVDDFTQAIAVTSDDADFYAARGKASLGLKKKDAAVADFNRAADLQPRLMDDLLETLKAYGQSGNTK